MQLVNSLQTVKKIEKIAIIQICSVLDPEINLKKIDKFLQQAHEQGALKVFLPECFYSMSDGSSVTPFLVEKGNKHYKNIQNLAKKYGVFRIGGSAARRVGLNIVTRSYNFSPSGDDLGFYDKINLFSCALTDKIIDESMLYQKGDVSKIIEVDSIPIGLSICFDLRFPELYRKYAIAGAKIIVIPAAFTKETGRAHWHTLIRARAIENQCFVVAAAQVGQHNDSIATYGHSLVVDPWGDILIDAKSEEGVYICDIDLSRIDLIRDRVKVF